MTGPQPDEPHLPLQARAHVRSRGRGPSRRQVLAALPSVAVLLLAVVIGAVLWRQSNAPEAVVARYEQQAAAALAAGDLQTARVCFERLLQIRPGDPRYRHGLALCAGNAHTVRLPHREPGR